MTRYADLFQSAETTAAVPAPGGEPAGEGTERFTLLFVDDEESVLHALRRIFLEENYEIRTARAAVDAIRILEEVRVHLVVTDHDADAGRSSSRGQSGGPTRSGSC
jgi:PleD family two-component response regulator